MLYKKPDDMVLRTTFKIWREIQVEYKIIADSCMELTTEMKESGIYSNVPMHLHIGTETIDDNENLVVEELLAKMKKTEGPMRSSCPSPSAYEKLFEESNAKEIFVVTISAELSGAYNSAMVAARDFGDANPDKKIAVINSCSASCGETLIGKKIQELKEKGMSFEEVIRYTERYRDSIITKFVIESLDNLRKNGRLAGMTAFICDALNIKPIMVSTDQGTIDKLGQARGMKSALNKLVQSIKDDLKQAKGTVLAISHCNNKKRAEFVKELIMKQFDFHEVIVLEQRGLSSLYAGEGGIIVSYARW